MDARESIRTETVREHIVQPGITAPRSERIPDPPHEIQSGKDRNRVSEIEPDETHSDTE